MRSLALLFCVLLLGATAAARADSRAEPPFLLDRLDYHSDSAYAGRFDPNPMHLQAAAQ
jgi:hypothetical protein